MNSLAAKQEVSHLRKVSCLNTYKLHLQTETRKLFLSSTSAESSVNNFTLVFKLWLLLDICTSLSVGLKEEDGKMAAGISVLFCRLVCFLLCTCTAQTNISAVIGKDVILPCKVHNNKTITAVKWRRPEVDPEYVLLYRDEQSDLESQHPSYQNRVHLQDKEMKDGNVSLILKNVKPEDRGTFKCWVFQGGKKELINTTYTIILVVKPGNKDAIIGDGGDKDGGDKDGGNKVGDIVGSVVGVILAVLCFIGFLIYKRCMKQNPNLPVPPDEAAEEQML